MKRLLILALTASIALPSCTALQSQVQNIDSAKISRLGDIALSVAVASGKISPADAALIRTVGTIVLPPASAALPVSTPPGKAPVASVQP